MGVHESRTELAKFKCKPNEGLSFSFGPRTLWSLCKQVYSTRDAVTRESIYHTETGAYARDRDR